MKSKEIPLYSVEPTKHSHINYVKINREHPQIYIVVYPNGYYEINRRGWGYDEYHYTDRNKKIKLQFF